MNIKYISIALIMLAILGIISYRSLSQEKSPRSTSNLIIGTATGYAPWVSTSPEGELEGFDIDVANALAQQMGRILVIKDLGSMTSLFTALDQGSIDAIIWGMSITHERLKKVAMVKYHGELTTSYPLIFWESIPAEITSINDMRGKTVCVEPASAQESALRSYDFITQLPTEKIDDALLNIQYGKADAAFVEPAIARKFQQKYPHIKIIEVPLKPEDQVAGVGIVLRKNDIQLIDQVTKVIEELKKTETITKFEQKWNITP